MLERGIDGKKNERCVDVREHEHDSEGAVEKEADRFVGDVQVLEKAVEHAVAAENRFPGVAADQIADPERDDHELIEEFFARTGVEGEEVRERVAEEERAEGHGSGDACGAQENLEVERIGEKRAIVLQIPVMDERAVADEPETVREHERVRKKEKQTHPEHRRGRDDGFVSS